MPTFAAKMFQGMLIGSYVDYMWEGPFDYVWVMIFALAFSIGASPGWGKPIGGALGGLNYPDVPYESWQKGFLKEIIPALIVRGGFWGLCVTPLYFLNGNYHVFAMPFIMALAFTVAPHTTQYWARMEYIRGFIIGVCLVLYRYIPIH